MTVTRFEDLIIWQESRTLCGEIYKKWADNHDYGFRDQIQRAAVSIMNNIAEGFDRSKNSADNKQLINFLNIAYGSCGEVKSMLYLAQDLNYITLADAEYLRNSCLSISQKITRFIETLKENNGFNKRQVD